MGVADGSNPAAVIVPLHRVIASNGYLESRACDLHCKRPLLNREKAIAAKVQVPEQRTEITLERRS
jgi:methylated-DNA-[protein]-cysteine S-methyltransferase